MKCKNLTELHQMVEEHFALLKWAATHIKPGARVRFKGSRSNIRGQWREVMETRISERGEHIYGYNPVDGRISCNLPSMFVVSKNMREGGGGSVVVAENNLSNIQDIELDGVWTSVSKIVMPNDPARPKAQIELTDSNYQNKQLITY